MDMTQEDVSHTIDDDDNDDDDDDVVDVEV